MDTAYYLDIFNDSLAKLNKQPFNQQGLELKIGVWLDSVALKIQKKSWLNSSLATKPFQESIFFSIWVNDESIEKSKLYYNIHALKMRKLTGYDIKSRDLAEDFRNRFTPYHSQWPNVNVQHGPLTLMDGFMDIANLETALPHLANNFLAIAPIIDELLAERKK